MKKIVVIITIVLVFILIYVSCFTTNKGKNENVETGRNYDNMDDLKSEDIVDYLLYNDLMHENYKSSATSTIFKELFCYFPNSPGWSWEVLGKEEEDYVVQFQSCYSGEEDAQYQLQVLLKPDFSMELLEDSIEIDIEKGFCVYMTNEEYVYHGCRVVEYNAEYYDVEKDIYFEAVIPLFPLQESDEWKDINRKIWEGLEQWITENDHDQHGKISLDYEIKTLDNDIFSILFSGEFEKDGKKQAIEIGITMSMSSGCLIPKSVFTIDDQKESFYDFYIEDNHLFVIINKNGNYESEKDKKISYLKYDIERKERQIYASDGRWLGQCYYELPNIEIYTDEAGWINQQMKNDMGRFFNELVKRFEEEVLFAENDTEYEANQYEPLQYYCYVESEVIYNNDGIFGVNYHYTVFGGEVDEEGEAIAVYNLEKEILEYEDWQEKMMRKISAENID